MIKKKRDLINEIIQKKKRLLKKVDRMEQFERRVHPLVRGYRNTASLPRTLTRDEWLKYAPIGYVACVEGYFRLLISDLINFGKPFSENVKEFHDIKFTIDNIVDIYNKKVTLGEYISHLLPISSVHDLNRHMSILLDVDFFKVFMKTPVSKLNTKPIKKVFPNILDEVDQVFQLRHIYCHELSTKEKIPIRKIGNCISSLAILVTYTEGIISEDFLKN